MGSDSATGVNPDSTTVFRNVFTITNKGAQPVSVWLTDNNPAVTFIRPDGTSLEAKAGAVTIRPGGRSLHVGLVIDSRGVKPGANLLKTVTIHTDADVSGVRLPASAPDGTAPGDSGVRGGTSGQSRILPTISIVGTGSGLLGGSRQYRMSLSVQSGSDQGLLETITRSLAPLGTVAGLVSSLVENRDDYEPPVIPVDETPISAGVKDHLRRTFTRVDNRHNVEGIIYSILKNPQVVEDYGNYQLIVGTYPRVDGWVALWVRGDTVVKAKHGGRSPPLSSPQRQPFQPPQLQNPITLRTPDGRTVTIDPTGESPTRRTSADEHDGITDEWLATTNPDDGSSIVRLPEIDIEITDGGLSTAFAALPLVAASEELVATVAALLGSEVVVAVAAGVAVVATAALLAEYVDDLPDIPIDFPNPNEQGPQIENPGPHERGPQIENPGPYGRGPQIGNPGGHQQGPQINLPGRMPGSHGDKTGTIHTGAPAYDSERNTTVAIPDKAINHIINDHNDWGHDQIGKNKQEVEKTLRKVIENPDEIWEDPNQDRWMYVKKMNLNGEEVIVTLFVQNGAVQSAFVPTKRGVPGESGYSDKRVKNYIRTQEMIKRYEINEIIPEVDEGEQAHDPNTGSQ